MSLTPEDLTKLCEVAIEAARQAGKHISETRPADVQRKVGGDTLASQVLTEVDGQSQSMILDFLKPTFAQFDLALLTEESEDDGSRLEKDYFWCIDPIDGTLPYIEGVPGYAVSIALVSREGVPQIGVVFDPVEHVLYHAIKGQGAFRNSEPWEIRGRRPRLKLLTDRSFAEQPEFPKILEAMEQWGYAGLETKVQGGAVMNACWVLENPPACYFKFPKKQEGGGSSWDFAATACIYCEMGAVATDIRGNPLELNNAEATFMNRGGALYATNEELAGRITDLFNRLKT